MQRQRRKGVRKRQEEEKIRKFVIRESHYFRWRGEQKRRERERKSAFSCGAARLRASYRKKKQRRGPPGSANFEFIRLRAHVRPDFSAAVAKSTALPATSLAPSIATFLFHSLVALSSFHSFRDWIEINALRYGGIVLLSLYLMFEEKCVFILRKIILSSICLFWKLNKLIFLCITQQKLCILILKNGTRDIIITIIYHQSEIWIVHNSRIKNAFISVRTYSQRYFYGFSFYIFIARSTAQ